VLLTHNIKKLKAIPHFQILFLVEAMEVVG